MGNLGVAQVAASQNNKFATINEATDDLDIAMTEILTSDYSSGDITLTNAQYRENIIFRTSNLSVPRALNVPAIKRFALIDNSSGTDALTVTRGTGTVSVPASETRIIYTDGTTNGLIELGGGSGGGGVVAALNDLTDVTLTSPSLNDFLLFDGSKWINGTGVTTNNWAVPVRGALVTLGSTTGLANHDGAFTGWNTVLYDTDNIWSAGNPSRLTVPAGVTKVRVVANVWVGSVTANTIVFMRINKNGGSFSGTSVQNMSAANADPAHSLSTAIIDVVAGDFFEVLFSLSDTSYTVNGISNFGLEIVETTDSEFRPFEVGTFIPGLPSAGALSLQHVFTRNAELPANAVNSQGFAGVAATAQSDFDIRKNGVSVGTMRFAAAGTVASFIVASAVSFAPGDRLELVNPNPQDSTLADVSATFALTLT